MKKNSRNGQIDNCMKDKVEFDADDVKISNWVEDRFEICQSRYKR